MPRTGHFVAESTPAAVWLGMSVAFSHIPTKALQRLDDLTAEFTTLSKQLEDPAVTADHRAVRTLAMQRAAIEPTVSQYARWKSLTAEVKDLEAALEGSDKDFAALAAGELPSTRAKADAAQKDLLSLLVTSDDRKVGSVILEVRAGTGGDEAALWAADLVGVYQKYAGKKGWTFEPLEVTPEPAAGGIRAAVINIRGDGVWSELAFEAGVHSVKRVPATEAAGRVHTSTASIAVLPEPEEVDIKIDWANEVEEFATRAQGPGGQNVNKVETAWQIHHKPTGIIIKMMEAKSQQQNRERARRLLLARLFEIEQAKKNAERAAARSSQIGTGGRSEKIRTYRYKDGIVADERLPHEVPLRDFLAGDLHKLMQQLQDQETAKRLEAI